MVGGDRADNVALPLTSENRAFPRAWETADFEKGTDGRLRALWHTSISVDFKIGSPAIFSAAAAALTTTSSSATRGIRDDYDLDHLRDRYCAGSNPTTGSLLHDSHP